MSRTQEAVGAIHRSLVGGHGEEEEAVPWAPQAWREVVEAEGVRAHPVAAQEVAQEVAPGAD